MPDTLQNGLKSKLEHKHVFTYSFMGTAYFIWATLASGINVIYPPPLNQGFRFRKTQKAGPCLGHKKAKNWQFKGKQDASG